MDIDNLVRMANRIGDYFAAYPDRDEAAVSIARHMEMFWTPQMRRALLDLATTEAHPLALQPLVANAVSKHLVRPAATHDQG